MCDRLCLPADQVVEAVVVGGVDETVADPFSGCNHLAHLGHDVESLFDTFVSIILSGVDSVLEGVPVEAKNVKGVLCCNGDQVAGAGPENLEGT